MVIISRHALARLPDGPGLVPPLFPRRRITLSRGLR